MHCLIPLLAVILIIGGILTLWTLLDILSGRPFEQWVIYDVFGRWTKK
mgnify:CR=1 FL=1